MDPLVIVGLSYVGKEAVAVVGHFTKEIFGASARAIGDGLAVPWQQWAERRAERAKQNIIDAALVLDKAGLQPQTVPGRVLLPLLEYSSVEEDESLRQRWVNLLASAAAEPNSIPPAFPELLRQLSPADVKVLDWLFENSPPQVDRVDPQGITLGRAVAEVNIGEQMFMALANLERMT